MPPVVATILFGAGIVALFRLDKNASASRALWIPSIWMAIEASRMVSQWVLGSPANLPPDAYLEGSPFDRLVLTALLAAGIAVVAGRWPRTKAFIQSNVPIMLFIAYCAMSVFWSDFPNVSLKRWMKSLGDVVMVAIVLTDRNPILATRLLFARAAFFLIPMSVLLIKYYPELGRGYNQWTWTSYFVGVATGKNGLGCLCLIVGLGSLWRLVTSCHEAESRVRTRRIIAHGGILLMTAWLLWIADSVTSLIGFVLAGGVLVLTSMPGWVRRPARVHSIILSGCCAVALLILVNASAGLQAVGRDTTLTGRTELWEHVLDMKVDSILGTGFESFWLGERVEKIWQTYWWRPNQAHNGYIEVFLNLGWLGLALLGTVMLWGYSKIAELLPRQVEMGSLKLALFAAAVIYNFTEAAFKSFHVVWFAFILAVAVVPTLQRHSPHETV